MNIEEPKPEVPSYIIGIHRITGPDQVDFILSRYRRFDAKPSSYEPETGELMLLVLPPEDGSSYPDLEFTLTMDFMRGHILSLGWIKVYEATKRTSKFDVCYGRDKTDGRRYRWYPRSRKQVFIDPEPQPAEVLQAA